MGVGVEEGEGVGGADGGREAVDQGLEAVKLPLLLIPNTPTPTPTPTLSPTPAPSHSNKPKQIKVHGGTPVSGLVSP